jgi:hypothetical protein
MAMSVSYPKVPLLLGGAGLIPFVGLSASLAFGVTPPGFIDSDTVRVALAGYGVVILSFLGGVRWGVALKEDENGDGKANRDFIISVIPALLGWFAWFQPSPADLWWLAAAHLLLGLLDYGLACRTIVQEWFGRLRLALAAAASLSLTLAALTYG